jgi:hypothetical protein
MASISPINLTSNLYNVIQPGAANAAQASITTAPAATTETVTTGQVDSVQLSVAAQAKLLHKEGQNVATIAASLGTNANTVDGYLGITVTKAIDQALQAAEAAATAKA